MSSEQARKAKQAKYRADLCQMMLQKLSFLQNPELEESRRVSRPVLQRMPPYHSTTRHGPRHMLPRMPAYCSLTEQLPRRNILETILQAKARQQHRGTIPPRELYNAVPTPRRHNSSTLAKWQSLDCMDGLPLTDCESAADDNVPRSTLDCKLHAELVAHYLQIEIDEKECYPHSVRAHGELYWGGWKGDRTARDEEKFPGLREGKKRAAEYQQKRDQETLAKLAGRKSRVTDATKSNSTSTDEEFLDPELCSLFGPDTNEVPPEMENTGSCAPARSMDLGYSSFEELEKWFPTYPFLDIGVAARSNQRSGRRIC